MKFARCVSVAVGTALLLVAAPTVLAVENGGVGGRPANPRDDNPRSKSIFVYELKPGESVRDAVTVTNNTDVVKTIQVYPADSQIASGGAFACDQKADERNQEGGWISMDKESAELQPHTEEKIEFGLRVPDDASVGEHDACIAIQSVEAPTASGVNGVQLSFRSAIRVVVTVPGAISKDLAYEQLKVQPKAGKMLAQVVLKNNGNVSLDSTLDTRLTTLFGTQTESINGEYPVLARQRAEFNFEFKKPKWGGFYRVLSKATYNADQDASLGEKSDHQKTVQTSRIIFVAPSSTALAIYLAIPIVLALLVWRWIRYRQMHRTGKAYTVKAGDDLQTIARVLGVRWKLIARINGIKPPYTLKAGQTIRLPKKAIAKLKHKKQKSTNQSTED